MKKLFYLLSISLFCALSFTSCSDDDDDEKFFTGDEAKTAIKGGWVLSGANIKSANNTTVDTSINLVLAMLLQNLDVMKMVYDGTYVTTTVKVKGSNDAMELAKDEYSINGDKLSISSAIFSGGGDAPTAFNFTVSNKNLNLGLTLNKEALSVFVGLLATMVDDPQAQLALAQLLQSIPNDYVGDLWLNLQR